MNLSNIRPRNVNTSTYGRRKDYLILEFDNFLKSINYETNNVSGKCLYLYNKTISQEKLRNEGFTITRTPAKADVIVIGDLNKEEYYRNEAEVYFYSSIAEEFFDFVIANQTSKFILDSELYKYLYKYTGSLELYTSINDLLSSRNQDNTKMAMEFIANANWNGNEVYLMELFNNHWYGNMSSNSFRTSISFKGLLTSLDFNHAGVGFHKASDYREYCKNDEHHEFVYKKYIDKFKEELDELIKTYKIKFTSLEYEIDKSIIND